MSRSNSDYSNLIDAILQDDHRAADQITSDLMDRVILYLRVRLGAPASLAEECAFEAFSHVYRRIREDGLEDRRSVLKYLMIASRNEYFRHVRKERKYDESVLDPDFLSQEPATQLEALLDEERQSKLRSCLRKLSEPHRRFILTFFSQEKINLMEVAEKFNFSYAKTRTLKTRIIQQLRQCVQKSV